LEKHKIIIENLRKEYIEKRSTPRLFSEEGRPLKGSQHVVLDDLNLKIREGELVCLLGPSGSGKSTLLRIIAGFLPPTSGAVYIDGNLVRGTDPNYIFMFQEGSLFPWMTVRQNIEIGIRNLKDKNKINELVDEYIDIVELSGFDDLYPHQLSGGMRQRAEFARALVVKPEILFMDESFSGLDFLTRLKMREELLNMHMYIQKTMLLVTHDIDEALQLADYLIVISGVPAKVKYDIRIEASHPRCLTDGFLSNIRKEVYHHLGVHYEL
jgi:NitT/TauT family transport system ATP-binding protein